jgi:hypothetical protein
MIRGEAAAGARDSKLWLYQCSVVRPQPNGYDFERTGRALLGELGSLPGGVHPRCHGTVHMQALKRGDTLKVGYPPPYKQIYMFHYLR